MLLGEERGDNIPIRVVPSLGYRDYYGHDGDSDDEGFADEDLFQPAYRTTPESENSPEVTMHGAIALINK